MVQRKTLVEEERYMSDSKEKNRPQRSVMVQGFTNSVLDPGAAMQGPVESGGTIIANTAPGCWGPMITPHLRGGHEVTQPVWVDVPNRAMRW